MRKIYGTTQKKLTIAMISKCHFCFYPVHSGNKWNYRFTHTHSDKKLLLVNLPVLHVVGELVQQLLWSWKKLDHVAHGNCYIDDDEDIAAVLRKTNLDNSRSPRNPRAPQANNPIYNSFWTSQVNPNANSLPLVFTCASP